MTRRITEEMDAGRGHTIMGMPVEAEYLGVVPAAPPAAELALLAAGEGTDPELLRFAEEAAAAEHLWSLLDAAPVAPPPLDLIALPDSYERWPPPPPLPVMTWEAPPCRTIAAPLPRARRARRAPFDWRLAAVSALVAALASVIGAAVVASVLL